MAGKQFPAAVRQGSQVLEFKKEDKDCVVLDRKLMDKQDCIERRMLKADQNSQLKNAVRNLLNLFHYQHY